MTSSMQILSARLAQVLSVQDVAAITQEVDRSVVGDQMTDDWLLRFARAIESGVLTTLAKQAPVATAWLQHGKVVELVMKLPCSRRATALVACLVTVFLTSRWKRR